MTSDSCLVASLLSLQDGSTQILQQDGELDRAQMRTMMAQDVIFRRKLNGATHLPIACEMAVQIFRLWLVQTFSALRYFDYLGF